LGLDRLIGEEKRLICNSLSINQIEIYGDFIWFFGILCVSLRYIINHYKQKLRVMRSYKIREGYVTIDGITYGPTPTAYDVKGKSGGKIHSISIGGIQYFPQSGTFDDGSIPVVEDSTGIVEETAKPKRSKKVK
jgi:hypothetical protein